MTRLRAAALMVLVTLLWSTAGIVSRQLESAASVEITFWRSVFNMLALSVLLAVLRGPKMWRGLIRAPIIVWLSGVCWAVMFTAFMLALTRTSVANTLVIMVFGPMLTALLAHFWLGRRIDRTSAWAIAAAGLGIAGMFAHQLHEGVSMDGSLIALAVPSAAAINWNMLQRLQAEAHADVPDMMQAVWVGAVLSALLTAPLVWPFQASAQDIAWLAFLGTFQLAVPCLLAVHVARFLPSHEIALLALLEVIFGVAWAWIGAGERPAASTLLGGAVVIGAVLATILATDRADEKSRLPA